MKRLLIAATALSLLGGSLSAAVAQPRDIRHDRQALRQDRRALRNDRQAHRWGRGERLPAAYRGGNFYVSDWRAHRLNAPPRGYRWVRRDNDYLLIGATTGLIASVIAASQ